MIPRLLNIPSSLCPFLPVKHFFFKILWIYSYRCILYSAYVIGPSIYSLFLYRSGIKKKQKATFFLYHFEFVHDKRTVSLYSFHSTQTKPEQSPFTLFMSMLIKNTLIFLFCFLFRLFLQGTIRKR